MQREEPCLSYRIEEDQDQPAVLRPASDDVHDGQGYRQDQVGGGDGVHHHEEPDKVKCSSIRVEDEHNRIGGLVG